MSLLQHHANLTDCLTLSSWPGQPGPERHRQTILTTITDFTPYTIMPMSKLKDRELLIAASGVRCAIQGNFHLTLIRC